MFVCVCVCVCMCVCVCVCMCAYMCVYVRKRLLSVELVVTVECCLKRSCHSFYMLYDVSVCRALLISHMCLYLLSLVVVGFQ